ncbi:cupin domain-containing protein [Plantactinospora soyae]|uniref:Quercetin dioxygenase-like cupin family protein n=1 Tax=Plantactinospora soyae TaxID=1544732 RepID=A0A927M441_9ACTN|nr:hypothetical protein [Plantactinospora soyae]MBE1486306.1 quercetin dioxygenase-like cupin family protein [Plantactinospora soyae]
MDPANDQVGTEVVFEDENLRVWILDLPPQASSPWHTHRAPYRYVVTRAGPVATEYQDGRLEYQDDKVGDSCRRSDNEPHRLVNLGDSVYQNVIVEFLDPHG